jgi:hypothetical protein
LKEQDEVKQNRGDNIVSRPALNSSHLGNDEFKSLGQASSELIAKLGKKAKVGARERTQPPSKITPHVGGENVIYLNSNDVQNLRTSNQRNKTKHNQKKDNSCSLFYIFQ